MVIDLKVLVRSFICEEWPFPDEGILINNHIYIYNFKLMFIA